MSWKSRVLSIFHLALTVVCLDAPCRAETYPIVDTRQQRCYDNSREITYPKTGEPFFGQDAQYQGNQPSYRDNGDGTISDLVTGLMWQKDPGPKKTFAEAVAGASACRVGGYDDWRLPSIKELYSLILFSGEDIDPFAAKPSDQKPFIDTHYFDFVYGDPAKGERVIDSQMATSTKYVSTTMDGNETMFGVNFADGRIKGYGTGAHRPGRGAKGFYVFYVRGNAEYGKNAFHDNGDGTIADRATGLIWQSIVDYTRSPDTTQSAAVDPVFSVTPIRDALGETNFPFYWSSTTHQRMGGGEAAIYVAFGRSQGWMPSFGGQYNLLDVHGAGSQRSDPKAGDPAQFPRGRGPQGDVIEIYNMVRPVRGGQASFRQSGPELQPQPSRRRGQDAGQRDPRGPGEMGPGPGGLGPRGRMGGNAPGFVSRLDRDGDGRVSRQEFDGPADAFDRHDANGDGYLSDNEGPMHQAMGPQQPGPDGARGPRAEFGPPADPLTMALDTNRDGQISAEEIEAAPAALKKLDRNGDGKLTRHELHPGGGPGFGGPSGNDFPDPGQRP